jgi:hypothetical protein
MSAIFVSMLLITNGSSFAKVTCGNLVDHSNVVIFIVFAEMGFTEIKRVSDLITSIVSCVDPHDQFCFCSAIHLWSASKMTEFFVMNSGT